MTPFSNQVIYLFATRATPRTVCISLYDFKHPRPQDHMQSPKRAHLLLSPSLLARGMLSVQTPCSIYVYTPRLSSSQRVDHYYYDSRNSW